MKLAIALTLVTLALCCSPASTEICSSFLKVVENLFLGTPLTYQAATDLFSPDADTKAAMNKLKEMVDHMPKNAKDGVMGFMDKVIKSPQCA